MMANPQTRKPVQEHTGIKVLIMTVSILGTLGGWGVLAFNQRQQTIVEQSLNASAELMPLPLPLMQGAEEASINMQRTSLRQVKAVIPSVQNIQQAQLITLRKVNPQVQARLKQVSLSQQNKTQPQKSLTSKSVNNIPSGTTVTTAPPVQQRPKVIARTRSSR